MSTNTGGPAFPIPDTYHPNGQVQFGTNGMTLLDWMAGQALVGMCASPNLLSALIDESETDDTPKPIAIKAYEMADAMLAEKARREAVVQESSTTDHFRDATKMIQDRSLDAGNMAKLEFVNRTLLWACLSAILHFDLAGKKPIEKRNWHYRQAEKHLRKYVAIAKAKEVA